MEFYGFCASMEQAIAVFLGLMYSYLNISISSNFVADEMKGKEIRHLFPMTLFLVRFSLCSEQSIVISGVEFHEFVTD